MRRFDFRRGIRPMIPALSIFMLIGSALFGCTRADEIGLRSGSPADHLPEWITPLLTSGVRPEWSADGSRLIYLDGLVGDVHELDLMTRESRSLTQHFDHNGFTRARYLSSGDILLCGPGQGRVGAEESDRWKTQMYFLSRAGDVP
ncbi:hypothetical protein MK280_03245, partial [Myxococcota bacterium]|nr:hypothetical protein [Myxococcota bacterium]